MTALTAARVTQSRNLGPKKDYKLAAVKVYAGGAAMMDSAGYMRPAAASVNNRGVFGVYTETVDNSAGAAGDLSAEVQEGEFLFVGVSLTQASTGRLGYFSDDQTFSHTQASNEPRSGTITEFVSSTSGWIRMSHELKQ